VTSSWRTRGLPADDHGCGWLALLPPPAPPRHLLSNQHGQAAVIGAGFTGLAVARQLAAHRPDWRIIVVEAQRVGDGASGRNSGFVVDLPHYEARRRGVEENRRLVRLERAGQDALRTLERAQAIECAWAESCVRLPRLLERSRGHECLSRGSYLRQRFYQKAEGRNSFRPSIL
jgi:glycine/D-amino acid oxidase-like deaminating enzyme